MTMTYARIADRTVADEYFAVSAKVEALYHQPATSPADAEGPVMARLRREHHRMLGNGYCARPVELDCAFETICETCTYLATTIEFRPTIRRQQDDATTQEPDRSQSALHETARRPRPRQQTVTRPEETLDKITRIMPVPEWSC